MRKNKRFKHIVFLLIILVAVNGCSVDEVTTPDSITILGEHTTQDCGKTLEDNNNDNTNIGKASTIINGNKPYFTLKEKESTILFEKYSPLDNLGRAVGAFALLGPETLPVEERGAIGNVKPSGWHTVKYPDIIEDIYLYNRCHLIAFCLSGENANEKNLITGTRYMNVEGMLPYEIEVANYIENTENHVLYRATPVYEGNDLIARGVRLEAYSVEDYGEGICFHVFCHNIQPGIIIDYSTGESEIEL